MDIFGGPIMLGPYFGLINIIFLFVYFGERAPYNVFIDYFNIMIIFGEYGDSLDETHCYWTIVINMS